MKLTIPDEGIVELTGGLTQPSRQVDELRAQGFWRARLRSGRAILEVEHYRAVCAGAAPPSRVENDPPKRKSARAS